MRIKAKKKSGVIVYECLPYELTELIEPFYPLWCKLEDRFHVGLQAEFLEDVQRAMSPKWESLLAYYHQDPRKADVDPSKYASILDWCYVAFLNDLEQHHLERLLHIGYGSSNRDHNLMQWNQFLYDTVMDVYAYQYEHRGFILYDLLKEDPRIQLLTIHIEDELTGDESYIYQNPYSDLPEP